jgi:rubrerythrin
LQATISSRDEELLESRDAEDVLRRRLKKSHREMEGFRHTEEERRRMAEAKSWALVRKDLGLLRKAVLTLTLVERERDMFDSMRKKAEATVREKTAMVEALGEELGEVNERFKASNEKQKDLRKTAEKAAAALRSADRDVFQKQLQRAHEVDEERFTALKKMMESDLDTMRLERDGLQAELADFECAICLETKKDPTELAPCRHTFCDVCVTKYLKGSDGNLKEGAECPRCRAVLTGSQRSF